MMTEPKAQRAKPALKSLPTNGHTPFEKRHRASSLREKRKSIRFEYEGEPYEAIYNHAAITVEFQRQIDEWQTRSDGERVTLILSVILIDWDLVQEDGETPAPVSVEEMERLPVPFLVALINAIFEDYNPPPTPDDASESSF
jgi:hypothetical protein